VQQRSDEPGGHGAGRGVEPRNIMECKYIDFLAKVYRIGVRVIKIMELSGVYDSDISADSDETAG